MKNKGIAMKMFKILVCLAALPVALSTVQVVRAANSSEHEFLTAFLRQVENRQKILDESILKKQTELAMTKFDLRDLEISFQVWPLGDFSKKIEQKRKAIVDLEKNLKSLLGISQRNLRLKRELVDDLAKTK